MDHDALFPFSEKRERYGLLGHQENGENLVDTTKSTSIDLAIVDGVSLEELLEDDAVLAVLSGSDSHPVGLESLSDSGVTEDIVRRSGLLNEAIFARCVRRASQISR